ncbi:hypothetical protein FDECE_13475 [Fusarium decemcellulare]|nr:hypothetical protein FDECE_13475 [Fusarium decemcellulare]
MKFTLSILSVALFGGASALPNLNERAGVQTVHLTFHGGPASYKMTFPADGKTRKTNSNINVNIIDANDYNAFSQCTFTTKGKKTLVQSISQDGSQHIIVGPPQVITAVSCHGMCVPTYDRTNKDCEQASATIATGSTWDLAAMASAPPIAVDPGT